MRLFPAMGGIVFAPIPLLAADGGGSGGFSFLASFLQMLASLALVIGVIFIARHLTGKLLGGARAKNLPKHIRVIESRFLGPKKTLLLVEVGGEYLLLANCGDGVNLIKQIDMLEEIEVLDPGDTVIDAGGFQGRLNAVLSRASKGLRPVDNNVNP